MLAAKSRGKQSLIFEFYVLMNQNSRKVQAPIWIGSSAKMKPLWKMSSPESARVFTTKADIRRNAKPERIIFIN